MSVAELSNALDNRQLAAITAELQIRQQDPIRRALASLTQPQRAWLDNGSREKVLEGGNQSGKTYTSSLDLVLDALGLHPTRKLSPGKKDWRGWVASTTYEAFGAQAWKHLRGFLLYPGESVHTLPTRRILEVGWDKKTPERVSFLKLRREGGGTAELAVKSYDSSRSEFQSAELDKIMLDEECPDEIYGECQPRILVRGGQLTISATPVEGVAWLNTLRKAAARQTPGVFHARLSTKDNPALSAESFEALARKYAGRPDLAALRLEGIPTERSGLVYPELLWDVPGRVIDPFNIPAQWPRYFCIDHGYRVCACLWLALDPYERAFVCREYYGEERRVEDNAQAILNLMQHEGNLQGFIDPAACAHEGGTGSRVIDLYCNQGLQLQPAPDNRVEPGINKVGEWLARNLPDGTPVLRFFNTCTNLFRERESYRWLSPKATREPGKERPEKREDHLLDCLRYLLSAPLSFSGGLTAPVVDHHRSWV